MEEKRMVTNEIEVTLRVIGGKWKPLILNYLRYEGTKRYSEIVRYLQTAPKKTVTSQLRELEADGIVERNVIPTVPVQVEYSITEHGKTLYPILKAMCEWGFLHAGERYGLSRPTCGCEKKGKGGGTCPGE